MATQVAYPDGSGGKDERYIGTQGSDGNSAQQARRVPAQEQIDRLLPVAAPFQPDVAKFLISLYSEIYKQNLEQTRRLYDSDFNNLTEIYFQNQRWPSLDVVEQFYYDQDRFHSLIMTLYTELYYRHVFSKCTNTLTWHDRKMAWENYYILLKFLVADECRRDDNEQAGLLLPSQWLWDMLDEFVYQYQDTCRWKMRNGRILAQEARESEDPSQILRDYSETWKSSTVLTLLHSLVENSRIRERMRTNKEEFYRINQSDDLLKYQLGYFAMICLLRVNVLMGNYHQGIQMVSDMELSTRALYWKAPASHITLFYNLGFAYMMMRRYSDAIRHMSQLLIFLNKQRSYLNSQSYQQSAMSKITDRMYLLVMMCNALSSSKLDESINSTIKEKYPDKFYKLQQDDEDTYEDMFTKACPKFINPVVLSHDNTAQFEEICDKQGEPHLRQLNIFLKEVRYLKKVSNVRSFAKLYNNIQLQKLGSLMEIKDKDPEDIVRSEMLCVKHKSRQQQWRSGSLLSGDFNIVAGDVEFYLDHNMLHVKSSKKNTLFTDYFLEQIHRCQDLLQNIQKGAILPMSGHDYQKGRNADKDYQSKRKEVS